MTGGAGFIGSALVRRLVRDGRAVVNADALTYAGSLAALAEVAGADGYHFAQVDVRDAAAVRALFERHRPVACVHLAAESHVDRSIDAPATFMETNVLGTFTMLQEALRYWQALEARSRDMFRFLHVSTDEVFGSLGPDGAFTEASPYRPNSPYAASKAAADHLARAWYRTYGLPVIVSNCSNNYGPYQYPEKLIPLVIHEALAGRTLPVYGAGEQVRDWLYVDDHVDGLLAALSAGRPGEAYLFGSGEGRRNVDVVGDVCALLDGMAPAPTGEPYSRLIRFVEDRPGHDERYAVDPSTARRELRWAPRHGYADGLRRTVSWYVRNRDWCAPVDAEGERGRRRGLAVAR